MDRDEAIARGLRVHETQHSMKRRSPWHDYHGRGTYMLTLVVEGRMPLLGKLWGRVDARPGDGDAPKVMLSELGIAIAKEEIPKIHNHLYQSARIALCSHREKSRCVLWKNRQDNQDSKAELRSYDQASWLYGQI